MNSTPTIIERAYQLASAGSCRSVEDIRRKLKEEAYESVDAHISQGLLVTLRGLIAKAKAARL